MNKKMKICVLVLIIMIIATFFNDVFNINNIYANVNEYYTSNKDSSVDLSNTKGDKSSNLIKNLCHMIYAVAGIVEKLVRWLMERLVGAKFFPWADKVIFNAMPFLDINFFNPAEGSLYMDPSGAYTTLGKIVRNLYYTVFVITISFLGVIVGVMTLKLIFSSVAGEKAKYKESIGSLVFTVVLLFTIHYLMSFIFFVNEKMVEIASVIMMERLSSVNYSVDENEYKNYSDSQIEVIVADFVDAATKKETEDDIIYDSEDILHNSILDYNFDTAEGEEGKKSGCLTFHLGDYDDGKKRNTVTSYKAKGTKSIFFGAKVAKKDKNLNKLGNESSITNTWRRYMFYLIMDPVYNAQRKISEEKNKKDNKVLFDIAYVVGYDALILTAFDLDLHNLDYDTLTSYYESKGEKLDNVLKDNFLVLGDKLKIEINDANKKMFVEKILKEYNGRRVYNESIVSSMYHVWELKNYKQEESLDYNMNESKQLISNMGNYFKQSTYGFELSDDGKVIESYKKTNFNPVGAILYTVFVFQSMAYFVAYFKRVFYVTILAMFAPLVVIYDFLNKIIIVKK